MSPPDLHGGGKLDSPWIINTAEVTIDTAAAIFLDKYLRNFISLPKDTGGARHQTTNLPTWNQTSTSYFHTASHGAIVSLFLFCSLFCAQFATNANFHTVHTSCECMQHTHTPH